MARAIWTGTVGFGLVQIPVALHGGEEHDELDMRMLDRRDFSPIGYERINKVTGKEVPWAEIVKGYEHAEGEYVVLTDADFEAANVKATRQIDILDFVDFSSIDPRLIDRPYYLAPTKAGRKAYALLRDVLRRTGKAGIGKIVIRSRQHLAALVARDRVLLIVLLRFADEIRDEADLDLPDNNLGKLGVTPKEIAMAEQLVKAMVTEFEPKKYVDEYRRDLMNLIHRKVKAGEVNQIPSSSGERRERAPKSNVVDLAALLAKSLSGGTKSAPARKKTTRAGPAKAHARGAHGTHHRRSA